MSDNYAEQRLEEYTAAIDKNVTEYITKPVESGRGQPTKYHRRITHKEGWSDIYDVVDAYGVTNAPLAHAIKKMLCAGTRGYKDFQQDVQEAIDSLERAKDFPPVPF